MNISFEHLKVFYNALKQKMKNSRGNWEQNDPTADDYIKNRPFYEETTTVNEPLNITWDGNTEGLVCVDEFFYKVSDLVLTDEQIKSSTFTLTNGAVCPMVEAWEDFVAQGDVTEEYVMTFPIAFIRKENVMWNTATFSEPGIYFGNTGNFYVTSFTTTEPVEQATTVVHKLDKKYLPDNIGGIKYVTISQGDNCNYTASATYAQISEWIKAGLEVKCVCGEDVLSLVASSVMTDISAFAARWVAHVFHGSIDGSFEQTIYILDTDEVEHRGYDYALRSDIPTKVSQLTNDSGYALKTEIPEQVQADWDQTDEAAVDYIKNKPCSKNVTTYEPIFTLTNCHFTEKSEGVYYYNISQSVTGTFDTNSITSYELILDGVSYMCIGPKKTDSEYAFGNDQLLTAPENAMSNTAYVIINQTLPAIMIYSSADLSGGSYISNIVFKRNDTVSYTKLEDGFIPDTIARKTDIPKQIQANWNQTDETSVDYVKNKPTIGSLAAKDEVAKSDLSTDVQASLDKADTALQSYTETDPTVPAWAKATTKPTYTAEEVGTYSKTEIKDLIAIPDWNQTDSSKADYIKNKPELGEIINKSFGTGPDTVAEGDHTHGDLQLQLQSVEEIINAGYYDTSASAEFFTDITPSHTVWYASSSSKVTDVDIIGGRYVCTTSTVDQGLKTDNLIDLIDIVKGKTLVAAANLSSDNYTLYIKMNNGTAWSFGKIKSTDKIVTFEVPENLTQFKFGLEYKGDGSAPETCEVTNFAVYLVNDVTMTSTANIPNRNYTIWSWDDEEIINPEPFAAFCNAYKINRVYQHISTSTLSLEAIRKFVGTMQKNRVSVNWLTGDPSWALANHHYHITNQIQKVVSYNMSIQNDYEKIGTVQFDIEPYTLDEWNTDKASVIKQYQDAIVLMYNECIAKQLSLNVCVASWFDGETYDNEYGQGNLFDFVSKHSSSTVIMAYNTSAYIAIAEDEIRMGAANGKNVAVGLETQVVDDSITDDITFANKPIEDLYRAFETLFLVYKIYGVYKGYEFVIHDYTYFKAYVESFNLTVVSNDILGKLTTTNKTDLISAINEIKAEVANLNLITIDDIDAICGANIVAATASEVTF